MFDLIGKTVGPYRILEQIGAGGMATVYKAYQPNMDRYVAIKVLPIQLSKDPEFTKRFEREARAIARLEHAHILPVHDYGDQEGITYIAMRYIKAGTLKDRMSAGRLSLEEINRLIGQIGGALDYAHRMGVIHRDVKPANVLMDDQGDTYLSDFGLARMMEPTQQITGSGVGLGTPAYMSPEQGQGIKVDHRSDIYSLGIILFEMLTGRVPYEAETPMAVVLKHITGDLPLPRTLNPNTPEAVERVILKALSKDPADRYQTAGEMVQALDAAVRMARVDAQGQAVPGKVAPVKHDVLIFMKIQRLWDQRWGKIMLVSGALAVVLLLGFLLIQLLPESINIFTSKGLYDDFSNPAFDGKFNEGLWVAYSTLPNTAQQQDGIMVLSNEVNSQETVTSLYAKQKLETSQGFYVESKMQLSSDRVGEYAEIGFGLRTTLKNGEEVRYSCPISRSEPTQIWCEIWGRTEGAEFTTDKKPTNFDTWHTVRIEVTPEIIITFYIDGEKMGSYKPVDSELFMDTQSDFHLEIWSPSQDGVVGKFDDVRIWTQP